MDKLFGLIGLFLKMARDLLMSTFTGWGISESSAQIIIYLLGILLLIVLLRLLEFLLVRDARTPSVPPDIRAGGV